MEQQRKEATERLLSTQGHNNLFYSEENDGVCVGDGGLVAVSNFTSILGLSIFMAACITFGFGCAIGYSSPTQSSIMEDLGLSVTEFSLFGSILSIGSLIGAAISGKITDLFGRKLTMWILNLFYIGGWLAIAFTKAKVGREKELEAALLCLRGDKADISDEAIEIKNHVESLKSSSRGGIVDIFQKKYVRPLLTVVGMMVLTNLGGINAFAYYSGAIFVSAGISSMVGLITLAATQTVVGILGTTIIDKLGRRPLLLVSSAGLCFSSFLTGVSFFLKDFNWWDQGSPILAFIGLLMYMGSYALGGGLPWLLVSEVCKLFSPMLLQLFMFLQLFPINVKGSAGSICNFMGNSTGWVVGYYFNLLTEWSSAGIFFTFSAFCCANFILIATMVPETKGRTLEEIQASITPSSD
ncbi:sugar transporter ERD6-like 15 isoform X4 [Gossypium raimondii]|uniref:sugar transporter ERD6-like 15 isoform X4 n=1 Tax=Gossypium raimondii TaxID=29730 RepID=UPI00227AC1D7|nr:sugar transporter ERD6-like 15 isoform X4 [Gossypium raimondii]